MTCLFKFNKETNTIELNSTLKQSMELFKVRPTISSNVSKDAVETKSDYDSQWLGGTLADLYKTPDMSIFKQAKEDLKSLGLQKLQSQTIAVKRRRVLSEHDGDFDLDRRWDFKPFITAQKIKSHIPHIEVLADMSISAKYSAHQINQYGALVWAITQLLEDRGINITVRLHHKVERVSVEHHKYLCYINIKDSKTYISPQAMAQVFTSNFKRRVIHHQNIMAADFMNSKVDGGLGSPRQFNRPVEYKEGTLKLAIGSISSFDDIKTELTKILKGS